MVASDIAVNLLVCNKRPLPQALDCLLEAGCSNVELAYTTGYATFDEQKAFTEQSAEEVRLQLEKRNMRCRSIAAHIDLGCTDAVDRFTARLRFGNHVGASMIISNATTVHKRNIFIENIKKLSDFASNLDLTIALENPGDGNDNLLPNGYAGALLINELHLPNVKLNYDYSNALSYSKMQLNALYDCAHALPVSANLHIKDMKRWKTTENEGWDFCAIGEGDHDYTLFFAEVKRLGRMIPMSLELPLHMQRGADYLMIPRKDTIDKSYIITVIRRSMSNILNLL